MMNPSVAVHQPCQKDRKPLSRDIVYSVIGAPQADG